MKSVKFTLYIPPSHTYTIDLSPGCLTFELRFRYSHLVALRIPEDPTRVLLTVLGSMVEIGW